jgi:hypothetical protein
MVDVAEPNVPIRLACRLHNGKGVSGERIEEDQSVCGKPHIVCGRVRVPRKVHGNVASDDVSMARLSRASDLKCRGRIGN